MSEVLEVPMAEQKEIGKIKPKVEQKPAVTADALVKSSDATFLGRLKDLVPEKARHSLRLSAQKTALTASALGIFISSGCGNVEQQRTPLPIPTPAVSELSTGMPSAATKFFDSRSTTTETSTSPETLTEPEPASATESSSPPIELRSTPPPAVEEAIETEASVTPSFTQEAPTESPQPQEQQVSKELVSYTPSITILDAAPSAPTEGLIQKEFVSNDEMIRDMLGDKYVSIEQIIQEFGEN